MMLSRLEDSRCPQLPEGEEPVREPSGRQEDDTPVRLRDRPAEQLPEEQEVLGLPALIDPHGDPPLAPVQERPDVHGAVEDREIRIVGREHPSVVPPRGLLLEPPRELGIAGHVVGDLAHAAGKLVGGEDARASFV